MDRAVRDVLDVARSILGELDVEVVLERVADAARELTGANYAALGILGESESTTELVRFIAVGIDDATRARIGAPPLGKGVLGELIRDPVPLRLADVGRHPRSYGFPRGHPPMRTFLGVPIVMDGKPFGNLYMAEKTGGTEFTEADEQAAVMFAGLAAVAVGNAQRYTGVYERREELERTVSALEATTQITRAVSGKTDLSTVLELVAKRGRALVKARVLLIELRRGEELIVAAGAGELPEEIVGRRISVRGTAAEHALRTSRPQRLEDDLNRARFDEHGLGALGVGAKGGLVMPLVFRGRTYGVLLALDRLEEGPAFTVEDERLLDAFAASAASAVATAQVVATDLERLAAVVESSSDAILTVDANGLVTTWNPGAEVLYGYSFGEMLGKPGSLLLPADKAEELEILPGLLRGEAVERYESTRVRRDGSRVDVSLSASAVRDSYGDVIGAASIARDITERKAMERALAQTQRLESFGRLTGGLAHDMNNLLGIILNHADFALDGLEDVPASVEVREIRLAAERAAELVSRLLLLATEETVASEAPEVNVVVGKVGKGQHADSATSDPAAVRSNQLRSVDPPPVKPSRRRPHAGEILLVEDEATLRSLVVRILEMEGNTVHSVGLPSEAIELANRQDSRIELLLTDIVMPEMSGVKLVERLRSTRPDLRVLYTSGYALDQGTLSEGAAFIGKPYTRAELLDAVARALERPSHESAGERA